MTRTDSIVASWSDITMIYDFFQYYTQTPDMDESERITVSTGLNTFLKDQYSGNSPDLIYTNMLNNRSQ